MNGPLSTELRSGNVRQYGMIIALAAIVMLFQVPTDGVLLEPINVTNLVVQNAYILILAIGMVIVIMAGHIDLSVGSVAAFVGAVCAARLMPSTTCRGPLARALPRPRGADRRGRATGWRTSASRRSS